MGLNHTNGGNWKVDLLIQSIILKINNQALVFSPLELKEADKVFSFFYFFLHFVTGCSNFSLRREDCTDERQNSATNSSVESPAQGAVS